MHYFCYENKIKEIYELLINIDATYYSYSFKLHEGT